MPLLDLLLISQIHFLGRAQVPLRPLKLRVAAGFTTPLAALWLVVTCEERIPLKMPLSSGQLHPPGIHTHLSFLGSWRHGLGSGS